MIGTLRGSILNDELTIICRCEDPPSPDPAKREGSPRELGDSRGDEAISFNSYQSFIGKSKKEKKCIKKNHIAVIQ